MTLPERRHLPERIAQWKRGTGQDLVPLDHVRVRIYADASVVHELFSTVIGEYVATPEEISHALRDWVCSDRDLGRFIRIDVHGPKQGALPSVADLKALLPGKRA